LIVVTGTAVALQPVLGTAERKGVELATNLLEKVERVLVKCARQADREVNGWELDGHKPDANLCKEFKTEEQTWAAYLGLRKHTAAWLCLRAELQKVLDKKRFLLEPRFQYNEREKRWEYLDENTVSQFVSLFGWKALEGIIMPDIVILDERGYIVHVYDYKFPCPEAHDETWTTYQQGRWEGHRQDILYSEALGVQPLPITPIGGVRR
jgi:hypothetical protein